MGSTRSPEFHEGWVTLVNVTDGAKYVWWGQDGFGEDYLGTTDGRVAVCETAEEMAALVHRRGWTRNAHLEVDDGAHLDLRPAHAWLRGHRALEAEPAINLWNFAEDVLRSTSGDVLTSGAAATGLHARLTEAAVPYLAAGGKRSTWSARDFRRLHTVLERADQVVRDAL